MNLILTQSSLVRKKISSTYYGSRSIVFYYSYFLKSRGKCSTYRRHQRKLGFLFYFHLQEFVQKNMSLISFFLKGPDAYALDDETQKQQEETPFRFFENRCVQSRVVELLFFRLASSSPLFWPAGHPYFHLVVLPSTCFRHCLLSFSPFSDVVVRRLRVGQT